MEAEGYHIWIDTVQIKGGDDWFKAIIEGIEKATFFISIASKNAKESRWVQREFLYAEQKNKIILPIKIDESDIPVYMLDRHVLIADKNFDTALAQLTELISKQVEGILQEEALSDTRQFELDYLDKLTLQYNILQKYMYRFRA
ncbi:MAG: toll/interleukin-1 receptor domain-containing protein [Anaerolineae bacterium]|nr:toll/interleukin-1 receptor domain-containing protein [Anaerolineae bacterium]